MNRAFFAAALAALISSALAVRADIFQWEYINPADPSQGKRQSATLAPDGAGVDAAPGANLSSRNLTLAYLIGARLTDASFRGATLTGADLSGAEVRGGIFRRNCSFDAELGCIYPISNEPGTGITLAQLYSTASYQAGDLSGIDFRFNTLAHGNFAGQNLTNANLAAAYLTNADFTAADLRGANLNSAFLAFATMANLIRHDGHIDGLDLHASGQLVVRDYDGNPSFGIAPIAISVDQQMTIGPSGTLQLVFEADAWDSTISFAPAIPVTLGGTLELTFADDVNVASQVGRTLELFDWTGVTPTGAFTISGPYAWDLSNLYTTGEVTLTAIPEPASLLLSLAAAALLFVNCRLRSRRTT